MTGIEKAEMLVDSGIPLAVSIAPSFPAHFEPDEWELLPGALKALGFVIVEPTNTVLEKVMALRLKELENRVNDVVISSCCPRVNTLIKDNFPEAVQYLSEVPSPATFHARELRKKLGHQSGVIFCGPCLCKGEEAGQPQNQGAADVFLTFNELTEWINARGVWGLGPKEKMSAETQPWTYSCLFSHNKSGINKCFEFLNSLEQIGPGFYELLACPEGCIGGSGIFYKHNLKKRKELIGKYIDKISCC